MSAPPITAEEWLRQHDPDYRTSSAGWRDLKAGRFELYDNESTLYETASENSTAGAVWIGLGLTSAAEPDGHCADHRRYLAPSERQSGRYYGPSRRLKTEVPPAGRSFASLARECDLSRAETQHSLSALIGGHRRQKWLMRWFERWHEHRWGVFAQYEAMMQMRVADPIGFLTGSAPFRLEPHGNRRAGADVTEYLLGNGDDWRGVGHVTKGGSTRPNHRPPALTGPVTVSALRDRLAAENPTEWTLDELAASLRRGPRTADSAARRDALVHMIARLDWKARHARTAAEQEECGYCGRTKLEGRACSGCGRPAPLPRTARGTMAKQAHPNSVLLRPGADVDVERVEHEREWFERWRASYIADERVYDELRTWKSERRLPAGFGHVDRAAREGRGADEITRHHATPTNKALAAALGCGEDAIKQLRRDARQFPREVLQEGEGYCAFRHQAPQEGETLARLSPEQRQFQRPLYVSRGLDLETLRDEIIGEIREARDELAHMLIVAQFGETPGDAAERILSDAA